MKPTYEELQRERDEWKREAEDRLVRIQELDDYIAGKRPNLFHDSLVKNSNMMARIIAESRCNELAAHVERLREALSKISIWIDDDPVMCQEIVADMKEKTPAQSLRDIESQVEEETIERLVEALKSLGFKGVVTFCNDMPRKYAKDGE